MRRYTTPTQELTVQGIDLTGKDVYVTYKQRCRLVTIDDPTVSYDEETGDTALVVNLTQLQTAMFNADDKVRIQVNWVDQDGMRNATVVRDISVTQNLLQEELTYGE